MPGWISPDFIKLECCIDPRLPSYSSGDQAPCLLPEYLFRHTLARGPSGQPNVAPRKSQKSLRRHTSRTQPWCKSTPDSVKLEATAPSAKIAIDIVSGRYGDGEGGSESRCVFAENLLTYWRQSPIALQAQLVCLLNVRKALL